MSSCVYVRGCQSFTGVGQFHYGQLCSVAEKSVGQSTRNETIHADSSLICLGLGDFDANISWCDKMKVLCVRSCGNLGGLCSPSVPSTWRITANQTRINFEVGPRIYFAIQLHYCGRLCDSCQCGCNSVPFSRICVYVCECVWACVRGTVCVHDVVPMCYTLCYALCCACVALCAAPR